MSETPEDEAVSVEEAVRRVNLQLASYRDSSGDSPVNDRYFRAAMLVVESAVRASEREAVVRIVEGERLPHRDTCDECFISNGEGCTVLAQHATLNRILAALRAAPTTPET